MANSKNVKVPKEFADAVKARFETDQAQMSAGQRQANWEDQFAPFINTFIQKELVDYDKDIYQRLYHKSQEKYPGPKTIQRAFRTKMIANMDLIHACGWYAFNTSWPEQSIQFGFEEMEPSTDNSHNSEFELHGLNAENGDADVKAEIKKSKAKITDIKAGQNINIDIKLE